ncbi:hypothetical protein K227x_40240 [Rubripirellula lacrimiformis]|uniref:Uncharacterized protein n=1 Tax=Rubripirellula lacrimiformis TaxID=1930273 RepID=A0A517NER9_9BACT|nr:hypothetical protein [Rubripirellula lacrimiformis]QDT05623.1 hypothetical protein K227x_40240 [Rubripirellula lacrimiformis]
MKLKTLVRFPFDIRRARQLLREKPAATHSFPQRGVALVLRTDQMLIDGARHLATIAHHTNQIGSPLTLVCDSMLLAGIAHKPHGRSMLMMPGVDYAATTDGLPADTLVLTDSPQPVGGPRQTIQMQIGRDIDRTIPVMPYPMHPATLRYIDEQRLAELRDHQRWISVLFAGNQKERYGDSQIRRGFGMLNRLEMLTTITDNFEPRIVQQIAAAKSPDAIVLSDSRVDPVSASDWLPAIASADFFLCCPGSSQPTCHHLIEAMSVGTIPIIEYGDRVTPPLVDGETAICFSGRTGLIDAVHQIDEMPKHKIQTMRRNVADFYDAHLCGATFMQGLRDGTTNTDRKQICMPFHHENLSQPNVEMRRAA